MRPNITYMTHENTWEQIAMFFPGLTREDLPDGEGWAVEMLSLSTHNGTHMDAPWHYHSTTDNGATRSEEHTSELQSLMRISYAVFCLNKKRKHQHITNKTT